jgi:hypothetical protein
MENQQERRGAPRRKVHWGARIAGLDGGRYMRCVARDFSSIGARVDLEGEQVLDPVVWLLDLQHRVAYEARIAWRRNPEVGLEFLRCYRFNELPSQAVRDLIDSES